MSRLEDLTPGTSVNGILSDTLVTVVSVQWFGTDVTELTYKDAAGKLGSELLYREDEPTLQVAQEGRPWSFDGPGDLFRQARRRTVSTRCASIRSGRRRRSRNGLVQSWHEITRLAQSGNGAADLSQGVLL
jgi:hypothetical protein